jgi:hypothetical protein
MKKVQIIFALVAVFSFIGCGNNLGGYYNIKEDQVYHKDKLIEVANLESFVVLENERFAKDKNNVYFYSDVIKKADPESFVSLERNYGKDKDFVYWQRSVVPRDYEDIGIKADPESAKVLDNGFINDGRNLFSQSEIVEAEVLDCDEIISAENTEEEPRKNYVIHVPIGGNMANAENAEAEPREYCGRQYLENLEIELDDIETFADTYIRIADRIYYIESPWRDLFNFMSSGDNERALHIVENADLETFALAPETSKNYRSMMIFGHYQTIAKDKNNVYCKGRILESADPDTIERLKSSGFHKDKQRVYNSSCEIVQEGNPEDFDIDEYRERQDSQ